MKRENKQPKSNLNTTLLGRVQARCMAELKIDEASFSNENLVKKRLLEVHREKPSFGKFLIRLLSLRETWRTHVEKLPLGIDLDGLVEELECAPWAENRFVEIEQRDADPIGVFIYQEKLQDGGHVYVITVLREEKFPKVWRAEIRTCSTRPEPFLSVASVSGYSTFSRFHVLEKWDELHRDCLVGLLALYFLNQKKAKLAITPKDAANIESKELFSPPDDPYCDELIQKVAQREIRSTQITVPLIDIKPADYEFSILLPAALIRPFLFEIRNGDRPRLLVYWNGKQFVVSDDYAAYLAYRTLGIKGVPVVVMGEYPVTRYGRGKSGGVELLPDVTYRPSHLPSDPTALERALDSRLQSELILKNKNPWFNLIFQFHRIINNKTTKERELHDLLIRAAKELAPGAYNVLSEVALGRKYRMDLAVQLNGDAQRIVLVELERANLPLFTKSGAPYAHVTHAMQQVEDWIRFWQEHPDSVPHPLDSTIAPSGVVILGRSKSLSADEKRRLLSLNANRRVQLITYDDLAERLETYAAWNT